MTMLRTAVEQLQRGFHIFPTNPGEKTPLRTARYPNGIPWSRVATNDVVKVVELWDRYPHSNPAVACSQSGLFVVDADIPKDDWLCRGTPYEYLHGFLGPRVDGESVLDQACERLGGDVGYVYDTFRVRTTRGGCHFYFTWPPGVQASQSSIIRGVLDVRGNGGTNGGYVLGAGSATAAGPYVVEHDSQILTAPPWLVRLCTERVRGVARPAPHRRVDGQWSTDQFGGLAEQVRMAGEGNRNNCLSWAARCMCTDGATVEEAIDLLVPITSLGEREAVATIRSSFRVQQRKQ